MLSHRFLSARSPLLPFWQWLEHFLNRQPDLILTSTPHAREHLHQQEGIPTERLLLLPDSVDPHAFRPRRPEDAPHLAQLREALHIPPDRPIIAYLGLLATYQGVDTLIHAMRHLIAMWDRGAPPLLLLMGFPFVERYRGLAHTLGLSSHVRLTGTVPYDQAPHYLRLAQVAVAPKRPVSEGAGKLLPYMATGLPVVATDTPAHRTYLHADAYYCRPDDAQDMARALYQALTDPDAPERGARLRQRVEAEYTWDHAGKLIEDAYAQLLRGRSTSP